MRRVAALLATAAAACASYDPAVLDERLRGATFDAYVETIEVQFGGLEAAGVTGDDLRDRFGGPARDAETPAAFYGVLRRMLCALRDPHASLSVSPRFWDGPVAEPEWSRFARDGEAMLMGAPARAWLPLDRALERRRAVLAELGASGVDDLDGRGLAQFLRTTAAFGGSSGSERRGPLAWRRVLSIDGAPVRSPHDGELLGRGAVGSIARVRCAGIDGGPAVTYGLLRNAGVFEETSEAGGTVRRRFGPFALADRLDPGGAWPGPGQGRSPRGPREAVQREERRLLIGGGRTLYVRKAEDGDAELMAMRLPGRGPRGAAPVGYLRIAEFRASATEAAAEAEEKRFHRSLERIFTALDAYDTWIIDLCGNPGGSWRHAGLFMSYFLDPEEEVVPHAVRALEPGGPRFWPIGGAARQTTRLRRAPVRCVAEGRRILVLIDQSTASAGEIVASMLRGRRDAVLIGERSAGAEFSTAEFRAPDGSVLRIGLGGGMQSPPYESFQGVGLAPDVEVPLGDGDPETARAVYRYRALRAALERIRER